MTRSASPPNFNFHDRLLSVKPDAATAPCEDKRTFQRIFPDRLQDQQETLRKKQEITMIKTGTLIASALIATVSFAAPSFAQQRSQYDIEQQRLNDIRQQTSDSGLNTINRPLDRTPWSTATALTQRDLRLQSIYTQHDETLD
jgi:hypothetical protein